MAKILAALRSPAPIPFSGLHQTLIWAVACVGVTIGSIAMANVVAPSVFPWLPAGIAAGVVLRFGWKYAALGGLGLGIALTMLPGRPSDDILWISTIAASHVLGLTLLPLAMGESGRRISASRIRSVDAARLVLLGIPVVILPTGLVFAAWLPVTGVGRTPLVEALPTSLLLGLLAGMPITAALLPRRDGRLTYHCHAERLLKVAPGLALLLGTMVASWWITTGNDREVVHLMFAVAVLASLTWLATHSGWFASSLAMVVVCFGDPTPAFGSVLMLWPVLAFGIVVAATMEQKYRHSAKIQDRHAEIDSLLQATGAAVIRLDHDGRISFGNSQARALLGRLEPRLEANDHFSLAFDSRSRRLVGAAIKVAMTGKRRECEVSITPGEGPRSLHLAVFTPLHDAAFQICGCSVVLLDLATSRRRAILRQRRQEQEFKSLAHALVHDVNNLAMAVGGAASLARNDQEDSVSEMLAGIEDTCIEAAQRTERIRQIMPQNEPGRLVDLGRIASERLRRHSRRGRITIAAMSSEAGTIVDLPESFAEFIVDEFVNNAVDAAPTAIPEIALTCRQASDNQVVFQIGDNGPGIPTCIQERIGNGFVTTKGGGRGLGLRAIATGVRAAGGRLRIVSDGLGTVLQITLPLSRPNRQTEVLVVSEPRRRPSMTA